MVAAMLRKGRPGAPVCPCGARAAPRVRGRRSPVQSGRVRVGRGLRVRPSLRSSGVCAKEHAAGKDPQVPRDVGARPRNLQGAARLCWQTLLDRLVLMNFCPGVVLGQVVPNSAGGLLLRRQVSFRSHFLERIFESLKSKTSLNLCPNNAF